MAFISEIHYRNSVANQTGISEFVEVTLSPAELARAGDFQLATYQTDGTVRDVITLSDLTPVLDPDTGYYVFEIVTPVTDPNHTTAHNEAEAVALVDNGGAGVISFFDIGGGTTAISATEGPALGATSTNIPPASGQSIQFDAFGNRIDGTLDQDSSVICLTGGTLIRTADGERPIEELRAGDRIVTRDRGMQVLRMVHSRRLSGVPYRRNRKFWPVLIKAGALGHGLPLRDLRVSPQHRMLVSHFRFSLICDEPQAFVRAKSLAAAYEGASVDSSAKSVTYYHLVFDQHEVIYAEGAETESFHPGAEGLAAIDPETREEFLSLFPELATGAVRKEAPYPTLRSWEMLAALAA